MLDRRHLAVAFEPSAPVRSADPRRRILDALVQTVALRGYERTTIDRVLALAEVPAPVFDEHFEDKQDCLLAALDELIARIERRDLRADSRLGVLVRAGARSACETLLAALAGDPDGARVAFVECLSAGEPAIARVRSAMASFVPTLEEGRSRDSGRCRDSGLCERGGESQRRHRARRRGHRPPAPADLRSSSSAGSPRSCTAACSRAARPSSRRCWETCSTSR